MGHSSKLLNLLSMIGNNKNGQHYSALVKELCSSRCCIATLCNLFGKSVFEVTMPTVVGPKCIFGSPAWAGKRGRKCFPWSGFSVMTDNEAGFVQEENNLFALVFNVWKQHR